LSASPRRNMSVPTIMDELVLYAQPEAEADAKPGLGAVQPRGRAQVMQQWVRPELSQADGLGRGRASTSNVSARPLLRSSAQQAAAAAPDGACAMEMEWSSLSDSAKQAMKLWVSGQLGGRHCMLVLEQGAGTSDAMLLPSSTTEPTMSDLKSGAALNVLSGLFAEVGLLSSQGSSWLFETVFSKPAQQVLEEALLAALTEIGDPRLEKTTDLSLEQANLALRRMAMKVQFKTCNAKAQEKAGESKTPGGPRSGDEFTKIQVWTELIRLHSEGWPRPGGNEGNSSQPHKDKTVSGRVPAERGGFGDGGVLKELNKQEVELEAESQQMSLEALRAQNRLIEEYVMRLVRQRDELKLVTKLAEERDSYFILGLSGPDSTDDEVKKAYRNLARKEHPDKAGTGNKRRFQAIQQAYNSIMKQRNGDGSANVATEDDKAKEKAEEAEETSNPVLEESARYAMQACNSADNVAVCAHHALRSWEEGAEGQSGAKRRAFRSLRDLTRQSASELRGAAQQLRTLGHAINALVKCSEAFLTENQEMANNSSSGMGLRDRCAIVEDSGRSCTSSAELLERISEATEATLKKVEKASPDAPPGEGGVPPRASSRNDEAANLLRLGVRLLTESLARTAAVARRSADEAINGASKALELHRGLLMLDAEVSKENQRAAAKRNTFDEDDSPVAAPDVDRSESRKGERAGDSKKDSKKDGGPQRTPRSRPETPMASQSPRDQLKSAARRVKDRHVNLRVKNLRFMASLNEEALRVQARLWSLLERSEGALLPEVSVGQKGVIFDLVTQLMDFALHETGRLASNLSAPPVKVLDRSLSFALALEHGKEIAMPVDSRTQALKLASLIDTDLLCEVVGGPFRRRLVAIGAKKRGPESFSSGGGYMQAGYSRARGTTGLGVGSAAAVKAWEEAASACCERISRSIRQAVAGSQAATEEEGAPAAAAD